MKVLKIVDRGKIDVIDQADITQNDIKPNDVLIRVKHVSLCGSDYKLFNGNYGGPSKYPISFGHEWSGQVEAIGANVTRVGIGQIVTGDCSQWCGTCPMCARDKNLCFHIEKYGITVDGFAQQFKLVPEKYLYTAASEMELKALALSEPVSVVIHGIKKMFAVRGSSPCSVLVLGCGFLGLTAGLVLRDLYGFSDITLFDTNTERRNLASKLGFVCYEQEQRESIGNIESYTALYTTQSFEVVFDVTGNAQGFDSALDLVRPLGTVVCMSIIPPFAAASVGKISLKGIMLVGSIGGTGEFVDAINFIHQKKDIFLKVINREFDYLEANAAFSESNRSKSIKTLINF